MPIRLPNVHGSSNSRAPSATVRESLQNAVGANGTLQAAALKGVCNAAEQAGPAAMQELKQELATLLQDAQIGGRSVQLDPGARSLAQSIVEPGGASPSFQINSDAHRSARARAGVDVRAPASPSAAERSSVEKAASDRLLGLVEKHKDVAGTGQEAAAGGDARVNVRRGAVATLIANRTGAFESPLAALGDKVKEDIRWLTAAERSDYSLDGSDSQFGWAQSSMSNSRKIQAEFKRRIGDGETQAKELQTGKRPAYDASSGSVVGISFLKDPEQRTSALVDTLLQFRGRVDKANQEMRYDNGSQGSTRADLIAPTLLAEQRILLAAAELNLSDPAKVREYALLREVIASHPTSSVNGIFEARNAVGAINMDGASGYGSANHDTVWIKEEVAPGASESAYKSIHHNFSRDTPNNVEMTFRHWVFPKGPEERRGQLFLVLADAHGMAHKGDVAGARNKLAELEGTDAASVQDLTKTLTQAADGDVAAAIASYLVDTAEKPLAQDSRNAVEKALKSLDSDSSWARSSALRGLSLYKEGPLADLYATLKAQTPEVQKKTLQTFLDTNKEAILPSLPKQIQMFASLYRSVCAEQPGPKTLEKELYKAGDAFPEIADVIAQLRVGNDQGALKELGEARLAMRDAIIGAEKGFERHEMIKFDAQLSRLTNTELGAAVDRVGKLTTDPQKAEALLGVQTALRSAVASGLHELKDDNDPLATKGESLTAVLKDVDSAISSGKIQEHSYRELMSRVYVAVSRTVQNARSFIDARAAAVAKNGAELDPEFLDQFVKQSPLHYATALAEKGMRAGLKEEIGPRCVKNVEGMRILNSVGPVVFSDLVFAENTKELVKLKPPKDAMSVLYGLEEKKMVAVGGLIVDDEHAPGGNSHLNMYAMNNGITVLALPELRTKYAELFKNAQNEGGLFVSDQGGEFQMTTVDYAVENGLVKKADLESLRPGTNRKITYLESQGLNAGHKKVGYHEAMISDQRKTREVELFVPMDEVGGLGKKCVSFDDLATLGIHARHLAGEKGTVLALLRANPKLRDSVPDGSMVTTGRCRALLKEAGIQKAWDAVWQNDPKVGTVTDDNFLQSAFYMDADYRAETREHLQELTKIELTKHLIRTPSQQGRPADVSMDDIKMMSNELARLDGAWPYESADLNPGSKSVKGDAAFAKSIEERFGKPLSEVRKLAEKYAPQLSQAGKTLYDELRANPSMAHTDNWITRSSFTGEDRPGKSGAGQYESFFNLKDPVSRIDGVIGVMESTWMAEPIENNVADEVNLSHIMPSVVVQDCLNPEQSGVMISRDIEHGTRGQVYYQLVKGFGGGVEGGKTEEGTIRSSGHSVKVQYPGEPDGLVPSDALKQLREIVLETEDYFNKVVEEGRGYAVDMEVARQDGVWNVVQARVIQLDR